MTTLAAGQRFERYHIIRPVGVGVSGESYEAEDTLLQRKVTLKLIHPWSRLTDAARRQFFREMQGISTIEHPYLAAILDYGEVDGRLYIARRYVSSGSLLGNEGRLWFRSPLKVADAIHFAHQLAQALNQVHTNGYVHGSLTFSNILVLRGPNLDNEPHYSPFLLSDVGSTHFIRRFGQPQTPSLPITLAPEQFGGRAIPASDQYALAILLYFWFTGRFPFIGSPEEIEQLKLTETIPPLSTIHPNVSLQQEGILRRALSVYPDERYPSILTFTEALLASIIVSQEKQPEPAKPEMPEPFPQPAPDIPQPLPAPETEPVPLPEPIPESPPEQTPEVTPEVVPPAPDIALPIPETEPPPLEKKQAEAIVLS